MTTTATTTATTLVRYDVITDGGSAPSYRDNEFARIVARRDRAGLLSDVAVVVTWAGHEGRANIDCSLTLGQLTEDAYEGSGVLINAIWDADLAALTALIRSATRAHTEAIDNNMEITDYTAVRSTVAAALGEEPHPRIPVTVTGAIGWRSNLVDEDFVDIVPA